MTTWTQQDDTCTAKISGYTLKVTKSAQFGSWAMTITKGHIVKAGDYSSVDGAKMEAERAMSELK